MNDRPLTSAEALAASIWAVLAIVISVAYVWGRLAPLAPFALLGLTLATGALIAVALFRGSTRAPTELTVTVAICGALAAWLLSLAWPSLLPPGSGPDLTHHLVLVDYLERHWRLPDSSLAGAMGEMAHYTPGLHLMAVVAGAWARTDGLHAIYPVVALAVALKGALVFLIALRLVPGDAPRVPVALSAVLLAILPQAYFLGSFTRDSFLAQAFAELFAMAMWWAAVVWDQRPARLALVLFACAGVGAFLTWPVWIGAPVIALVAVVVTHGSARPRDRIGDLAIALGPIVVMAAVHAAGRTGWLGMAGTSGAALRPSIDAVGWPFLIVSAAGLIVAPFHRPARATVLLVISIAAQAATLYAVARAAEASTPYMALKTFYLLIYPLAVLGATAIGVVCARVRIGSNRAREIAAWSILLIVIVTYRRPITTVKLSPPVLSNDLYLAGRWARAQLEAACVDYLVPHEDTAYWLHLAVLGNPRTAARTADPTTFEPARNIAKWIEPGGLPYAIAHLPTMPKDVANDVDVLETFGTAAVVRRRGPSFCVDAERHAVNFRF
jgi:hypothetical protein